MKSVNRNFDTLFYFCVYALALIAFIITVYPFIYVFSVSISSALAVNRNQVFLWPVGFSLAGYEYVLQYDQIWVSYKNTFMIVIVGTLLNMLATVLAAYPLSRPTFSLRRPLNFLIVFSMYFSGGLIPSYLLVTRLGLYNSRWALILPILLSSYNVMICRSAFSAIPDEVIESAQIDGANDIVILKNIALRLITPTIAVLTLYYAVGHWNNFFSALLYISKDAKTPLQVILRRILIQSSMEVLHNEIIASDEKAMVSLQIRYVTIIVSTVPILTIYPFIQKYFVKGVMLGAVKG